MGRRSRAEAEEVRALRRKVQELQRRPAEEQQQQQPTRPAPAPTEPLGETCRNCGGREFRLFTTPAATLRICTGCKDRQKVVL
jgi:hypothetical protein